MSLIRFFVEGKKDVRLLVDYIYHISGQKISESNFYKIGGCTVDLVALRKIDFQKNTEAGGVNLVIFDSNGNFNSKQAEILNWHSSLEIEFESFLFPTNVGNGNMETLLENIALEEHRVIFSCFDTYQNCIGTGNNNYTLPNQKAKIYAYLEAILPKSKGEQIRDEKRDYLDPTLWNLNSDYLRPLREFLLRYL